MFFYLKFYKGPVLKIIDCAWEVGLCSVQVMALGDEGQRLHYFINPVHLSFFLTCEVFFLVFASKILNCNIGITWSCITHEIVVKSLSHCNKTMNVVAFLHHKSLYTTKVLLLIIFLLFRSMFVL